MPLFSRIASLGRNLTRKRQVERELTDEVSSYVELATQAKMKDGLTEGEARREALVEFGGVEQVKEQVRKSGSDTSSRRGGRIFALVCGRCASHRSFLSRSSLSWRWGSAAPR